MKLNDILKILFAIYVLNVSHAFSRTLRKKNPKGKLGQYCNHDGPCAGSGLICNKAEQTCYLAIGQECTAGRDCITKNCVLKKGFFSDSHVCN